jgi:hypothetical protein
LTTLARIRQEFSLHWLALVVKCWASWRAISKLENALAKDETERESFING